MAPRTIVVGFDFSKPSRRALEWARLFRARLHASVQVVHADPDIEQTAHESPGQRVRWLESEVRRELSEVFGPDEQAIQVHIGRGRPSEVIAEIALERGGDLVVVGASGKSAVQRVLLGSTTAELVRTCPLPVMTVPPSR